MSGDDTRRSKDYTVGYRRPPKANRFQPGKSGNPQGRKKTKKSLQALLDEGLERRVVVTENGRRRRMSMKEVIVRGLINDAAKQSPHAVKLLFTLHARRGDHGEESPVDPAHQRAEDLAIIEHFLRSRLSEEAAQRKPAHRRSRSTSKYDNQE